MSISLGQGYSIPTTTSNSIVIPNQTAPEKQLQTDVKQQISAASSVVGDTYKLLAGSTDSTPGFLSAKITSGEFSIVLNKLKLAGFGDLTTNDLTENTNLYWTQVRFDTAFGLKSTTNLTEGTNLYFTNARALSALSSYTDQVTLNTAARHSHSNKSILDATEESFTTALKTQYDALSTGNVTSATAPIVFSSGVISHLDTNGNKHVPTNAAATNYDVLYSNGAGVYAWGAISDVVANAAVSIFEEVPSTSTVKGVQSAYVNTHVSNGTTNVKHVTDANLTYINTTIPAHIASTLLHLPTITATTDRGKFLKVSTSDVPEWASSSTVINKSGTGTYVSVSGDTITVDKIDFTDTNIIAGSNITINTGTNTISASWRGIDNSPVSGETSDSISSGWAYTHENLEGLGSHVPSGGTAGQYLDGSGAWANFGTTSGGIYKITMGSGATGSVTERLAHADTEFPTGFSGAAGTVTTDLVITHDAARNPINIQVWVDDGTDITLLMGSAPYSTIIANQDADEVIIASLTTITEKIYIYIQFE
jgi:hypothetical protein